MKNPFSFLRGLLGGKARRQPPESSPNRGAAPLYSSGSNAEGGAPEAGGWSGAGVTVDVPLTSVGWLLPPQLRSRVRHPHGSSQTVALPLELILPQLAHGDVRITFGQLRQAAPHLFAPEADEDATMVQLPFSELASRCDPALLNYLEQQRGVPGQRPSHAPVSQQRVAGAEPRARANLLSSSRSSVGKPAPAVAAGPVGAGRRATLAPTPGPSPEPAMALATEARAGGRSPGLAVAAAPAEPASHAEALLVNLSLLAESWPEEVRGEIERLNLGQAQVALPKERVGAGLKEGRLAFSWGALRSWMQPPVAGASAQGQTELELPLKAIAPLFLAGRRGLDKPRSKVQVDEEIPDVFGVARPAAAAAAARPANGVAAERPSAAARPVAPAAARSGPRSDASSTPGQLVSRAVQLQGVAGALVTLRDGLLVASHVPEGQDAEKVAAFLPQIFSRLGQYTEELQMGELKTLEFLVGQVPWKAFRLKDVLFVVFGRGGEALPNLELGVLASELSNP